MFEELINVVLVEWPFLSSSPHNGKGEQYFGRQIELFSPQKSFRMQVASKLT